MKRSVVILIVLFILNIGLIQAQEQTGTLVGVVSDTDGEFLPGVTVEARSPAQPGAAVDVTDELGRYRLLGLTPGTYSVTFSLSGFTTLKRERILVRLGRTFNLEVILEQATIAEEITVVGESPVVDIKKSGTTFNYGKEMITKLPSGRDFTSIIHVTTGVNDEEFGGGTMMDGSSSSENMYFVDGVDTTSMYSGDTAQRVLIEFVEEVQVKSSGYEAEHGGSMGGVVNVITRSGGNEFHGEVSGYLGGSRFQTLPSYRIHQGGLYSPFYKHLRVNPIDEVTAEYIDFPEDDWTRYELGLALGGYIFKDKLWFFANFMPRITSADRTVEFIADGQNHTTSQKETSYFLQAKLTAMFGDLRLSASYINDYYKWRGELANLDGTSALPSEYDYAKYGYDYPGQTFSLSANWIASDNLFFNLNGGHFRTNRVQLVGPTEPRVYFGRSNAFIVGEDSPLYRARGWRNYRTGYQTQKDIRERLVGNFDATLYADLGGEHVFKAGVQFVRIHHDVDNSYPYNNYVINWGLNFSSQNFGIVPTTYGFVGATDTLGLIADVQSDRWAIFLQDSWTISNRFTLNLGIRAEKEDIPSFSDLPEYQDAPIDFDFKDKIAPRIGFAWDLFGDNSTKLFGSYGLYYDVMKLGVASAFYGGFKSIYDYYDILDPDWTTWTKQTSHPDQNIPGLRYIESRNWNIPAFDTTQPDMAPYSKVEFSLGLQRKLGEDISLTVRYLHNNIRWAIEDIGILVPAGEKFFIGNPGSDWINEMYRSNGWPDCPKAKRRYHSLNVGIDKRFSNNWMAGFHYTWSYLWGNFSGLASTDEFGRQSPNTERYWDNWILHRDQNLNETTGMLPTDRPHQFKLYGSYSFDWGLTVGIYSFAMSGTPISLMASINNLQGYYPTGRFTHGRTPLFMRTDLHLEYNLTLGNRNSVQFSANVTNLFDQRISLLTHPYYNRQEVYLDDEVLLAGYDYQEEIEKAGVQLHPMFMMPYRYSPGLDVRLGVKFIF
jgi:hypothetical protein